MSKPEQRGTERLLLTIPIRVMAFGANHQGFTEDSYAIEINRAGARIALKHRVATDDTLRIINLETLAEADFRVVGPTRLEEAEVAEWGVECLEPGRNIWGIEFPPPVTSGDSRAGALLECQGCAKQRLAVLTFMEIDILNSAGVLHQLCDQCGELSPWMYADITRRPREPAPPEPGAAPPQGDSRKAQIERRAHKRLPLKLPVLIRTHKGEQETTKTENVSKGGLAVFLPLRLAVGDIVTVACPYTEGGQNFEQKAEVRRRTTFTRDERWLYGFRYL